MLSFKNKVLILTLFAIAMGFLEAVVVVYLRVIYFPEGFNFPLPSFDTWIFEVELVREITTMVMLVTIGLLAGKTKNGRFGWFLFVFGVWDIAYYIGLKAFLNWPASLLTWDILFLIPVVWIGPVLAPVICALSMVVLGLLTGAVESKGGNPRFGKISWLMLILGSVLIFITYVQDFIGLLYAEDTLQSIFLFDWYQLTSIASKLVPDRFNWWLFGVGELMVIVGIYRVFRGN
jgi:uncharacterized membrane protein